MFLTPAEIATLTGRKTFTAQAKALNGMGITHKRNADGGIIVLRSHIEKILDGSPVAGKMDKSVEPNWSAMNGA